MTEVIIKSVTPYAEYDGLIYSYKVACILSDGREVIFIDEKPFDLTKAINTKVALELATSFISDNKECLYLFEGSIKYYNLQNEYYFVNNEITLHISKEIIDFLNIKLDEKRKYCFEDITIKNINTESPQI